MEKSLFEQQGGSYHWEGDYRIPNLVAPEAPHIGIWSQRRRKFLKEHIASNTIPCYIPAPSTPTWKRWTKLPPKCSPAW